MSEKKAIFRLILFFTLLIGAFVVPIIIMNKNKIQEKYFPTTTTQEQVTIREIKSSPNSNSTKINLETDPYFVKLVTSPNFNYANIKYLNKSNNQVYIEDGYMNNMIRNFAYQYTLTNTRYFTEYDNEQEYFCLNKRRISDAMQELYYVQTGFDNFIDKMPGYIEYVDVRGASYCFNYGIISLEFDKDYFVGIKSLSISDQNIITADVYLYQFDYYGTEKEEKYRKYVQGYIKQRDFSYASKIVKEGLNGDVKHKKVAFRINKNYKYYKYQLFYSQEIN